MGGGMKAEGDGGWRWSKYIICIYKNRIIKFIKIVFKRERGNKKVREGMNLIKVYYTHTWKFHNETPLYN
jgi:hypothetical protein